HRQIKLRRDARDLIGTDAAGFGTSAAQEAEHLLAGSLIAPLELCDGFAWDRSLLSFRTLVGPCNRERLDGRHHDLVRT
ncbi:MAG: hypothetical protein ACR2N5_02015, partial [Solirubrobacterales bacterium]